MTTPNGISATPTRIFQPLELNLEIETALILEKFKEQLKLDGKAEETIRSRMQSLNQVSRIVNINEPDQIKKWLANLIETKPCNWNNKTKTKFCDTYTAFLTYKGTNWKAPKYPIVEKLPFIPTEQEIDLLIAHCGKTTSTVLQLLKETGMRIGELTQLKWIDIDNERKTVNVTPEKHSNPRVLPISDKLIAMINRLPRNHKENVFQPKKHMIREYYCTQRKGIAERLQNQRLLKISFHTFRHWKGTMEYHKTLDIIHVKKVLGHKTTRSTEIYINLESVLFLSTTDEWISKVSHNLEEETQLIETDFQLVRSVNETTAIYKKRK
jgi:integrase/recombinase XerD